MALPPVKLYEHGKAPKFQDFVNAALPKEYPFYNQVWREALPTVGTHRPLPFHLFGTANISATVSAEAAARKDAIKTLQSRHITGMPSSWGTSAAVDANDANFLEGSYQFESLHAEFAGAAVDVYPRIALFEHQKDKDVNKIRYHVVINAVAFEKVKNYDLIIEYTPGEAVLKQPPPPKDTGDDHVDAGIGTSQRPVDRSSPAVSTPSRPGPNSAAGAGRGTLSKSTKKPVKEPKSPKGVVDYYEAIYTRPDFEEYIDTTIQVLGELDNAIKVYQLTFERPMDLQLQLQLLKKAKIDILPVFEEGAFHAAAKAHDPDGYASATMTMRFNSQFELMDFKTKVWKTQIERHPRSPIKVFEPFSLKNKFEKYIVSPTADELEQINREKSLKHDSIFANQTTNSLFVYLKEIHSKYGLLPPGNRFATGAGGKESVTEGVVGFLRKYMWPGPTIVDFGLTRDIIETFIIGDVRMLDENFYKQSRPSRAMIKESARQNAQSEVAKAYEHIGDQMGSAFVQGKFEKINNTDDFFKSLLNHVPVPELIRVAAQCLIKALGLDELKKQFCKDAILKYREYQADVLSAVASAGPAGERVALRLELLFEALDDTVQGALQDQITNGLKAFSKMMSDVPKLDTWRKKSKMKTFISEMNEQLALKKRQAGAGDTETDATLERANLNTKINTHEKRKAVIKGLLDELEEREKLFGKDKFPDSDKKLRGSIADGKCTGLLCEAKEIKEKLESLTKTQDALSTQIELYEYLLDPETGLIKSLVVLDPFIKVNSQDGFPYAFLDLDPVQGLVTGGIDAALNDISKALGGAQLGQALGGATTSKLLAKLKAGNGAPMAPNEADLGVEYKYSLNDTPISTKRKQFKNNMLPILEAILLRIDELETNHVTDGFKGRVKGEALEELDALLNDPNDGLLICAAVFAIIPAAIYALYYLFTHAEEVEKALQKDTEAIAQAFEKRVEIFLTTEYPVADIMKAFKEALIQMGINLARDLIISAIWLVIKALMRLCSDSEKTNAPYSPLGQIDLSEFIIASQVEATVEESKSFSTLAARTGLSLEDYKKLLGDISGAFTINQMCSLMEETAPDELYEIFLLFLQSLPYLHNTQFYDFYVNQDGIREFLRIISADIDPEFFVAARNTFERQKRILLNICGGTNEDIKALQLSDFMSPEELRNAMAAAAANRRSLLSKALDSVGNVLGGPMTPAQLCGPGEESSGTKIDPYHESQRFASEQAANAIFGGVENMFETEVARVKTIYRNTYNAVRPTSKGSFLPEFPLLSGYNAAKEAGDSLAGWDDLKGQAKQTSSGFAAPEIVEAIAQAVQSAGETTDNSYFTKLGDDVISFYFDPDEIIAGYEDFFIPQIHKKLTFLYSGKLMTVPGATLAEGSAAITKMLEIADGDVHLPEWFELLQGYTFTDPTDAPEGSLEAYKQIQTIKENDCEYWLMAGKGDGGNAACPDLTKEEYEDLMVLSAKYSAWMDQTNAKFYDKVVALKDMDTGVGADPRFQIMENYYALKATKPWTPQSAYTDKTCAEWYEAGKPMYGGTGFGPQYENQCPDMTLAEYEALKAVVEAFEKEVHDNLEALYLTELKTVIKDGKEVAVPRWTGEEASQRGWDFVKYMRRLAGARAALNVRCEKLLAKTPKQAPDPEETEAAVTEAKDEMELWAPPGQTANILLTVKSTDENATTMDIVTDPTLYAYATEKPPVIPHVMEKYAKYNGVKYYQKDGLASALGAFLRENDLYLLALNEMFGGLLQATGRNGLYLDGGIDGKEQFGGSTGGMADMFEKLQLTKRLATGDSQTKQCFLGFFNKRVLNSQVQKLTETLNCYSPMAVSKSATNLAYIKISLDCVIRAIVVKEMMKSLFVFGFASLDDLYSYEWSPTEGIEDNPPEPFFGAFLNEEIERALKKQFSVMGGGSFETFYTEVIEEFITGMMRILYQDETMTGSEAFNIIVRDQVGFVKKVLFNALPAELQEGEGHFSPKLIQQVKVGEGVIPEADKYLTKLEGADAVDYADQVRVLTNFELNRYVDTLGYTFTNPNAEPPWPKAIADLMPNGKGIQWADSAPAPGKESVSTGQFTFYNYHNDAIASFDASGAEPTIVNTNNLLEIVDGVNSGFVAEKFVEIKYNNRFYERVTQNEKSMKFLQLMFSIWESILQTKSGAMAPLQFLYDTKLIMLFPQLHILSAAAPGGPLFDQIGLAAGKFIPIIAPEGDYSTESALNYNWEQRQNFREISVLWRLFRYNFDANMTAEEKYALIRTYPQLDWTMTGKIPATTFNHLVSNFISPTEAIPGLVSEYWEYEEKYHENFNLSSDAFWKWIPTKSGDETSYAGKLQSIIDSLMYDPGNNTDFWLENEGLWYKNLSADEKLLLNNRIALTNNDEAINHRGKTFLGWFMTLPLEDVFTLDFGSRIVQYISEKDRPGIQEAFDQSALGQDGKDASGNLPTASPALTLTLLEEKIGKVDFFDSQGLDKPHRYVKLPIYSSKLPVTKARKEWNSSTWFEAMYKVHDRVVDLGTLAENRLYTFDDFFKPGGGVLGTDVLKKEEHEALKSAYTEHNAPNADWEWPALIYDEDANYTGGGATGQSLARQWKQTVKRWTTPVIMEFNKASYIAAAHTVTKDDTFPVGSTGQTFAPFSWTVWQAAMNNAPGPGGLSITSTAHVHSGWRKDKASPYYWQTYKDHGTPSFYSWGKTLGGFRGGFNRLWYDHFTNLIDKSEFDPGGDPFKYFALPSPGRKHQGYQAGAWGAWLSHDDYGMGHIYQTQHFIPFDGNSTPGTQNQAGHYVNWQRSGIACFKNKEEARKSFDEAYRNTLAPTIFNLEVADKVLHGHETGTTPIATRILNDFRENGSDDLKTWIRQREEFIARESSTNKGPLGYDGDWSATFDEGSSLPGEMKVWTGTGRFPWNPKFDFAEQKFEIGKDEASRYWRDTFILQMFLWQLQKVERVKDLYKLGAPGELSPESAEYIDITHAAFRFSMVDTYTVGKDVGYGHSTKKIWKFDSTAHRYAPNYGNSQKQGQLLDMLGTDRPFPYEKDALVYADYATLVDVLFPPTPKPGVPEQEPKKDIKTIMAKFAGDTSIPPHSYVGKTIESIPFTTDDPNAPTKTTFRELMQSFFIKEQGTMITLIHKLLAERYYPQLENNFNGTISIAAETLLTAIAVAQGDYQRTSSANAINGPSGAPMGGFDFGSLGITILKSFLGALASTVDPTWKTPWPWNLGIGPLTPIGVAAKLLHGRTSNFSSAADTPIEEPVVCNDEVDEQSTFIKYGPLIDQAPTGAPTTTEAPPSDAPSE